MTSTEIRQSFLDFFKSKGHTLVPSASLMPDSPNLLFTNAGMNQFVPIFLGQRAPDVSKWAGAVPASDTRAADTQKCIRAGGKHNDLEDVGLDTYHHTFFEMLGNWSFGDYFKQEAIDWAWQLVVERWKFPAERLYATVFCPHMRNADWQEELANAVKVAKVRIGGGRGEYGQEVVGGPKGSAAMTYSDEEAASYWAEHFIRAGQDPMVHVVPGNRKDNFWMMGDTGPCGPCSELHVDLTPNGDTKGSLVNKGDARCIEIWNLVFIQFNANPDGAFSPLPSRHVDTGMGFERVTGIIQNTNNFTDFTRTISNYETDIFRPLFDKLEHLSGKKYHSTLPATSNTQHPTSNIQADIAFRVIADHIRTLSFAIADGIQPGNTDRNYVLRRILRRAVRYGRTLGFHEPFFYKLVAVLADTMGQVFPELRAKQDHIEQVIQREEEAFNKTLDRGIQLFDEYYVGTISDLVSWAAVEKNIPATLVYKHYIHQNLIARDYLIIDLEKDYQNALEKLGVTLPSPFFSGKFAFALYDTYGFPLDLTELMARERGLSVDVAGFNTLMDEQRARARAAQKKQVIETSKIDPNRPTRFVGYESLTVVTRTAGVVGIPEKDGLRRSIMTEETPFYGEMGGQVGDAGTIRAGDSVWRVTNTLRSGPAFCHVLSDADQEFDELNELGQEIEMNVDRERRAAIQRHHTVTHLLHWALHKVVSPDATQKGSYVGPEKLTFDFSSAALTAQQLADVERLVNERILENAPVTWTETKYSDIKGHKDIRQFFGEKYGDVVRVVQIGGKPGALDGYSMELCGGTHTRATGEIGLFRIAAESAIAAGIRRIEAVSGLEAYRRANEDLQLIKTVAGKVNSPIGELEKKIESLLAQQKELEKQLKAMQQKQAADIARGLAAKAETIGGTRAIVENLDAADGDFLQAVADALRGQFNGVAVLAGTANNAVALVATVSPELTKKFQAGKIIQAIAPLVGGKGGGRPDNARGGGKDVSKVAEALAKAKTLLS